jgi:hypothetical protein
MMRSHYRRGPRLPQARKVALGLAKQPRWGEASQRANVSRGDTFDWKPEVEVVVGPPRKRGSAVLDRIEALYRRGDA